MLFPSTEFAVFFGCVWAVAWLLREANTARKAFLALASLLFYAAWDARFVVMLLAVAVMMLLCGQWIGRTTARRRRASITSAGILVLLALLGYFKYADLLIASSMQLADQLGFGLDLNLVEVAGPIVRAREFLPQLAEAPRRMPIPLGTSLALILGGLFKKVVIANYLATALVDPVYVDPSRASLQEVWGAFYGYALVIYCDFSAYTDIAIGIASLFGYRFPQNFDQPYRALSVQDFWNRWHITLSHWLRDYLYIPLGGNRLGRWLTMRNLMITMFLGGLWHGASGTFILWGGLHGVALMVHFGWARTQTAHKWRDHPNYQAVSWVLTFHTVCLLWVLFRSPDLETAGQFLNALLHAPVAAGGLSLALQLLLALGALTQIIPKTVWSGLAQAFEQKPLVVQSMFVALALLGLLLLAPTNAAPFIYFRF